MSNGRRWFMRARCFFFCILFFIGGAFLSAQDVFNYPLSAGTQTRYAEICAELSGRPLIKGTFEQTKTIKRLGRSLSSKGNFTISSDLGMIWDTRSPFPSIIAVGRDFIIQTVSGGAKTKLDAQGNEIFLSLADSISAIFSGKSGILTEKFENYFIENKDAGTWTLGLIPKDDAVRVFAEKIILAGGGAPALIRSILIYSRNGDTINYSLGNHYFPAALDADEKALFFL